MPGNRSFTPNWPGGCRLLLNLTKSEVITPTPARDVMILITQEVFNLGRDGPRSQGDKYKVVSFIQGSQGKVWIANPNTAKFDLKFVVKFYLRHTAIPKNNVINDKLSQYLGCGFCLRQSSIKNCVFFLLFCFYFFQEESYFYNYVQFIAFASKINCHVFGKTLTQCSQITQSCNFGTNHVFWGSSDLIQNYQGFCVFFYRTSIKNFDVFVED